MQAAGLVGMRFNTIGVSDGISMGTEGMSFSLPVARPHRRLDRDGHGRAVVRRADHAARLRQEHARLPDGDGPAQSPGAHGLRRHDPPGPRRSASRSTSSPRSSRYGEYLAGVITDEQRLRHRPPRLPRRRRVRRHVHGQHDGVAIEAMGMSLPYSSSIPAEDPGKLDECRRAGAAIRTLLERDLKPRDIMTREALRERDDVVMALGGSTNAVLHLIAMARAVDVPLTLDDFQSVSDRVPLLADLKPSGKYVQEDLHNVGGTPAVMKYLLERGLLDGDCMTVTGKTLAREPRRLPRRSRQASRSIHPLEKPLIPRGHIRILRGNLAPTARSPRSPARKASEFAGPARVYDSEEDMLARPGARRNRARATWSSSATKARKAARACPRC